MNIISPRRGNKLGSAHIPGAENVLADAFIFTRSHEAKEVRSTPLTPFNEVKLHLMLVTLRTGDWQSA